MYKDLKEHLAAIDCVVVRSGYCVAMLQGSEYFTGKPDSSSICPAQLRFAPQFRLRRAVFLIARGLPS